MLAQSIIRPVILALLLAMASPAGHAAAPGERPVSFAPVTVGAVGDLIRTSMPRISGEGAAAWLGRLDRGQVLSAAIDIDRDGTEERFVMATADRDCTDGGCRTRVLRFEAGRWWPLLDQRMPADDVAVVETGSVPIVAVRAGPFGFRFTLDVGTDLTFRPLDGDGDRAFARGWLAANGADIEAPAFWRAAVGAGQIRIAVADLDDDGRPERMLMLVHPAYCAASGCGTFILRRSRGGWSRLAFLNMSDTVRILVERRNGWHRLNTGTDILTFDRSGRIVEGLELASGEVWR